MLLSELADAIAGERLVLVCGVSGSGKTTAAASLAAAGFDVLSADELAWRRCGPAFATMPLPRKREVMALVGADIDATAADLLRHGRRVAIDATFCRRARRDQIAAAVRPLGVVPRIVHMATEPDEIRRRLALRQGTGPHDQIVGPDDLSVFLANFEVPGADENPIVVR